MVDASTLMAGGRRSLPSDRGPRAMVSGLALAGGLLLITGALLPWLSVYGGLDTLRGVDGINGRVLILMGSVSVLLAAAHVWRPQRWMRLALAATGLAASGFAAWVVAQLLGTFQQLGGDAFVVPSLGIGAFVSLAGGVCVLATLLLPRSGVHRATAAAGAAVRADARTVALSATVAFLLSSAVIHLAVIGPHLAESALYAAFFAGAALAQGVAAGLITLKPRRALLVTVALGNALVIAVWAISRTSGLPIGPTPGVAEAISLPDVLASVGEAFVVVLSAGLAWRRRDPLRMRAWLVRTGSVVAGIAAVAMTAVAVISVQSGGG